MKTIARLRFFCLCALVTTIVLWTTIIGCLRSPTIRAWILEEPKYVALFSQAVATYLYQINDVPVGVFQDENLSGCDTSRNEVSIATPPGLPEKTYECTIDYKPVWEVRYSPVRQRMCIIQTQEQYPRPIEGKIPTLSHRLFIPNEPEFTAGNFNTYAVRTIVSTDFRGLSDLDFRSLSIKKEVVHELGQKFPGGEAGKIQALFQDAVEVDWTTRSIDLQKNATLAAIGLVLFELLALGLTYRKWRMYAKNEEVIVSARSLEGPLGAVTLAGKTSFLKFCISLDCGELASTIWLQQKEALAVSREWKEIERHLARAATEKTESLAQVAFQPHPSRRKERMIAYRPKEKAKIGRKDETARLAASIAIKIVREEKALHKMAIPKNLFPENMPELQVTAATDILRTLLAGWGGGACFGERRMDSSALKRRVLGHIPTLTGKPKTYEDALSNLTKMGVVNLTKESNVISYAITSNAGQVTEQGKPIRSRLVEIARERKGIN